MDYGSSEFVVMLTTAAFFRSNFSTIFIRPCSHTFSCSHFKLFSFYIFIHHLAKEFTFAFCCCWWWCLSTTIHTIFGFIPQQTIIQYVHVFIIFQLNFDCPIRPQSICQIRWCDGPSVMVFDWWGDRKRARERNEKKENLFIFAKGQMISSVRVCSEGYHKFFTVFENWEAFGECEDSIVNIPFLLYKSRFVRYKDENQRAKFFLSREEKILQCLLIREKMGFD